MLRGELWEDVGAAIRKARLDRGWRQVDLAERVGVDRSEIARYELGTRVPSRPVAALLTATLDLDAYSALKLRALAEPSPQGV